MSKDKKPKGDQQAESKVGRVNSTGVSHSLKAFLDPQGREWYPVELKDAAGNLVTQHIPADSRAGMDLALAAVAEQTSEQLSKPKPIDNAKERFQSPAPDLFFETTNGRTVRQVVS